MTFLGEPLQRMLEGTLQTGCTSPHFGRKPEAVATTGGTPTPGCRRCGADFTFEQGWVGARAHGIRAKVLLCPTCRAVYEVQVTPRAVILLDEVTDRFGIATVQRAWWLFWK